jgi:hypothetical protein
MRTSKFSLVSVFSIMLIFCLNIASYSQNDALILTKKKNGKDKTIKQGKKIKIWTNAGEVYKGNFLIKEDSLVILRQGCVAINDIVMVSKKSTGIKILGGSLAGIGGITSVAFGIVTADIINTGGFAMVALIIVLPIEAVAILGTTTGVIVLTTGKKFKKTKWNYEIKKIES